MIKETISYHFTIEGETESAYFTWLQNVINAEPDKRYNVKIVHSVCKDPMKYAKGLYNVSSISVTHVFDIESQEEIHVQQVKTTLDRMKEAQGIGKDIKYNIGYSNFTFELWIILHKSECNGALTHRNQYLELLNKAYDEDFENLKQYKHKNELNRILSKLNLDDVRSAIKRAKKIMNTNKENGLNQNRYKGFTYYRDNPSLSIWESIEGILKKCNLL